MTWHYSSNVHLKGGGGNECIDWLVDGDAMLAQNWDMEERFEKAQGSRRTVLRISRCWVKSALHELRGGGGQGRST